MGTKSTITILFNDDDLKRKLEDYINSDDVMYYFYNEFYRLMKEYVPAESESMYISAEVSANGIHFIQPYSSYPYYGIANNGKKMNFKTDHHALATDHWDIATWVAKKDIILKDLDDYLNRRNRNG